MNKGALSNHKKLFLPCVTAKAICKAYISLLTLQLWYHKAKNESFSVKYTRVTVKD